MIVWLKSWLKLIKASKLFINKKLVHILKAVMPVHHHMLLADSEALFDYEVNYGWKMFFCGWNVAWIDVMFLECSKVQFAGRNVIRMRTLHENWNPQLLDQC